MTVVVLTLECVWGVEPECGGHERATGG